MNEPVYTPKFRRRNVVVRPPALDIPMPGIVAASKASPPDFDAIRALSEHLHNCLKEAECLWEEALMGLDRRRMISVCKNTNDDRVGDIMLWATLDSDINDGFGSDEDKPTETISQMEYDMYIGRQGAPTAFKGGWVEYDPILWQRGMREDCAKFVYFNDLADRAKAKMFWNI